MFLAVSEFRIQAGCMEFERYTHLPETEDRVKVAKWVYTMGSELNSAFFETSNQDFLAVTAFSLFFFFF